MITLDIFRIILASLCISYYTLAIQETPIQTRKVISLSPVPWGINKNVLTDPLRSANEKAESSSLTQISSGVDSREQTTDRSSQEITMKSRQRKSAPLKIVLLGAPSSGKGTQSERIVAEYGVVHLSTGDMLREAVKKNSELGLIAKEHMDKGELVPDELITKLVLERISQKDCIEQGWILDGFPRTRGQAEAMSTFGIVPDIFLFLDVPDSVLVDRVSGRRTDPLTGKIYHLKNLPPPTKEIRDRLVQRSDDTKETMKQRLKSFHANVNSIRECFQDLLVEISANEAPKSVSDHILKVIEESHFAKA